MEDVNVREPGEGELLVEIVGSESCVPKLLRVHTLTNPIQVAFATPTSSAAAFLTAQHQLRSIHVYLDTKASRVAIANARR